MSDSSHRPALIPVLVIGVALVALTLLVIIVGRDPVVGELSPPVAGPGEEVVIGGRHFGSMIETIVVAGQELPTSAVRSWTDEEIRFVVPRSADSGLLYVRTDRGSSEGVLLQIQAGIPRTSMTGEGPGVPVVEQIDASEVQIGGLLTIRGTSFGRLRRGSRVVFPMEGRVACDACDVATSYALWDDTVITVRVPAGATSGFLSVSTPWGTSNPVRIVVNRPAGELVASSPAEIGLRYGAEIRDVRTGTAEAAAAVGQRDIVLRLPEVAESFAQRSVRYLDDEPSRFRFEEVSDGFSHRVERTLLVDRYELRSRIDPARVSAAFETDTGFVAYYTRELPDAPVNEPAVREIASAVLRGRANPWWIAQAAYERTLDALDYALGMADRSVPGALDSGFGDDFTYAMLFVTITRAAGIPARPVGGVIVTEEELAYPHFWAEFFLPTVGWVPVDPSFGDGAFPSGFPVPEEPRQYYFGNLDNRRVAFGHDYDAGEPTFLDGVRARADDPYTLQVSYAEGGALVESFELDWHRPRLIGLYLSASQSDVSN